MYFELKENKPHGTKEFPYTQYHIYNYKRLFHFPVHWHDELEIIYVKKGKLSVTIGGEEFVGSDGAIFIVNPRELHMMSIYDFSTDYYTILFPLELISFQTEDALEDYFSKLRNGYMKFKNMLDASPVLCHILDKIIRLYEQNNKATGTAHSLFNQINIRICLLELVTYIFDNDLIVAGSFAEHDAIQRELINYIRQNYTTHLSLGDLAEHFHLSEKYISRYFKKNFYLTITQYISHLRLTQAKKLLDTTSKPITEVALLCGYSNVSYFIRSFKSEIGVSPLKYRHR